MLSISLLTLLGAFLAPTLVLLKKSTDDIDLPDNPNAQVKVYHTKKHCVYGDKSGNWTWTLEGAPELKIPGGYTTKGGFQAYVNNEMSDKITTITARGGKIKCFHSQTYFADVRDMSSKVIQNFKFKLYTRGTAPDHWHLLQGASLPATYVYYRGRETLSGPINRQDNGKRVAYIHCEDYELECKISTNDELPIDFLFALHASADSRQGQCVGKVTHRDSNNVPLLDGTNYTLWHIKMNIELCAQRLYSVCTNQTPENSTPDSLENGTWLMTKQSVL
ncbi:hypothetical protein O181_009062 [Austropuccinia psidii MF-1]|uniref:Uncharacterized protein n=1 Tax=Austropuccinia psidii MF-1 TaxID=1389203 RepID=A0A9Q3GJZ0_9BASI|nr:hypothetical protein [Austropuccinia psidii MF-1]